MKFRIGNRAVCRVFRFVQGRAPLRVPIRLSACPFQRALALC